MIADIKNEILYTSKNQYHDLSKYSLSRLLEEVNLQKEMMEYSKEVVNSIDLERVKKDYIDYKDTIFFRNKMKEMKNFKTSSIKQANYLKKVFNFYQDVYNKRIQDKQKQIPELLRTELKLLKKDLSLQGTKNINGMENNIPETYTESFNNLSAKDLRKKVFEIYKRHYVDEHKEIINKDKKILIKFDRTGANKTAFGGVIYPRKACLIQILDVILQNAKFIKSGDRKKTDPEDVLCYLNFESDVYIDNVLERIELAVRVKNIGEFHYSIDIPIKQKKD